MTDPMLHDRRILVVEDEDILACALETELLGAGAIVLGPVGFLEDALLLIRSEPQIDCVILDVNLQGKTTFSAAELLVERQVPFILATGYDRSVIPSRLQHIQQYQKPLEIAHIVQVMRRLIVSVTRYCHRSDHSADV